MELQAWIRPQAEVKPSEYPWFNEELQSQLDACTLELITHLYLIDRELKLCKRALLALQPMSSGRLDIRWWHGYVVGRHPYVFKWQGLPRNFQLPTRGKKQIKRRAIERRGHPNQRVYSAIKVPRVNLARRALKTGLFRETVAEVCSVLRVVEGLLKMRVTTIELIRRHRMAISKMRVGQNKRMNEGRVVIEAALPRWEAALEERIQQQGQLVTEHILLLEEEDKRRARLGFRTLKEHARIMEQDGKSPSEM